MNQAAMNDVLSILYRGPLSSCNYDCAYCPFAKQVSSRAELLEDAQALERFVRWVEGYGKPVRILFTPWGEALIRAHYRDALRTLSHLPHVERVAIQTNLSARVQWMADADLRTLALWTTFHPSQVSLDAFVARCLEAASLGVRFSVGVVGKKENRAAAEALRAALPEAIYVWVNAYKSEGPGYYTHDEAAAFGAIDSLFPYNNRRHASRGKACRTGESVISVDGAGNVRRCHFVQQVLGNLYTDRLESMLAKRPCPNARCGCHIGYVHLEELGLERYFGRNSMERIVPLGRRPSRDDVQQEIDRLGKGESWAGLTS